MGWLLAFVPRNHISFLFGKFAHYEFPRPLQNILLWLFARTYDINLSESELHIDQYKSLGDFFVRRLRPGCRLLGDCEVVHPADASISQIGRIINGEIIQAKGKTYTVGGLTQDKECMALLKNGFFTTYYLCPTDYHRVHCPVDGEIISVRHIPGSLWPVNEWSVDHIRDLFSVNERVAVRIQTQKGIVVLVFVGATNVGKIELAFDNTISTNDMIHTVGAAVMPKVYSQPISVKRGDELGMFRMGSTVVMLYPESFQNIFTAGTMTKLAGRQTKVNSSLI